jgi:hypothetical protein
MTCLGMSVPRGKIGLLERAVPTSQMDAVTVNMSRYPTDYLGTYVSMGIWNKILSPTVNTSKNPGSSSGPG